MEKDTKELARKRRHHKNRIRKNRLNDIVYIESQPINRHSITPKSCSCVMCGNPRNHHGNSKESLTIQEQRQIQHSKY